MATTNPAISKKLDELKKATNDSVTNSKKFDLTISKSLTDNLSNYYETYLRQTIGEEVAPVTIKTVRKKDEIIRFNAMPMHHKNTLLAMAFAKGEKQYSEMRKKATLWHKEPADLEGEFFKEMYNKAQQDKEDERALLSPVEYLTLSRQLFGGRNASLVKSLKKGELDELKCLADKEQLWSKVLVELRNFHAHIFHEPGPVSFKNLYGDEYKPDGKLTEAEWAEARDFFEKRFNDAREHKIKTLTKPELEKKNKKEDIEKVLKTVSGYKFEIEGYLTKEALLFIACMFLRKSDAEWFARKWQGMKKAEGVFKSTSNFFTENSVKESKSQLRLDNDMFKFRQIIGILSTMPELKNDGMKPFYEYIKTSNDAFTKKAEKIRARTEKEKVTAFIIPSRKSSNYTYWFMKYLDDNGLLNDFSVAYYKTPEDRREFLQKHDITSMLEFKAKMKRADGDEKKRLTAIYKDAKKNFLFKKPSANEYDNYCIKKLNVFIQHEFKGACIQVSLSPDFLMKWVFLHSTDKEKGKGVVSVLKTYLQGYYYACIRREFTKDLKGLKPKKIFPSSLIDTVPEQQSSTDAKKLKERIEGKLQELRKFDLENKSKRAPWKFASKRKIDIILEYVHRVYLDRAHDEKKTTDTMRHEGINDIEYQDIFEFIRYYGRHYQTEEFKKVFSDQKKTYFQPLLKAMEQLDSLEKIFDFAIGRYINYLQTVLTKATAQAEKYATVFKLKGKSLEKDIAEHAKLFAVNHCVPHEVIAFTDKWKEYIEWKQKVKNKFQEKQWAGDFAFIRNMLEQKGGFSNTDYLMSEIMPLATFPPNEKGAIQYKRTMFQALWRNKTNELMLWEIAKYYWKKATGAEYSRSFSKLERNTEKKITRAYKETNPFYQIFKESLTLSFKGNNNKIYKVSIKPKKLDDEYQYYEEQYIKNYIEHHIKPKEKEYHCSYEMVNKNIRDILTKYLDDVFLLLSAEKWIVVQNFKEYSALLEKDATEKLPAYYLPFQSEQSDTIQSTLSKDLYELLDHGKDIALEDLGKYRNDVMHQQLYMNEEKYKALRKALMEFCKEKNII